MYIEVTFKLDNEHFVPILINDLEALNFDSFWEEDNTLKAYISVEQYNENLIRDFIENQAFYSVELTNISQLENKNWNAEWERNFQPVEIDDSVYIRAKFHPEKSNFKHQILINPKMAFGTGHHATTYMMARQMLNLNFNNKTVFDYGCGTGILAILAEKLGAQSIFAIDTDDWAFNNAIECVELNNCSKIEVQHGDISLTGNAEPFEIILANINRNVILQSLQRLYQLLQNGGTILFSGILNIDKDLVINEAEMIGFRLISQAQKDKWMLLEMQKL